MADLTRISVLPISPPVLRHQIRYTLIAIVAAITTLVGVGAWFAGIQYFRIRSEQIVSELTESQNTIAKLRVQLHDQQTQIKQLKGNLQPSAAAAVLQVEAMRRQILQLQAELTGYQNLADRDRKESSNDHQLLALFSVPGVRMVELRGAESSRATGYALVLDQSKVLLVATNLPKLPADREYQLWLLRKDEPAIVSGGVFDSDDSSRAVVQFADDQLVSQLQAVTVTEEPSGGTLSPTGKKILYSDMEE